MKKNEVNNVNVVNKEQVAKEKLAHAATTDVSELYKKYDTSVTGMKPTQVDVSRKEHGENVIDTGEELTLFQRLIGAFVNPFTLILIGLAIVSYITDVLMAMPGERDYMTVIIIVIMVTVSGILQFVQESRSNDAAKKLSEMVQVTTLVKRQGKEAEELPVEEVVVGDIIYLSAGDMIPADLRIIEAKDLFITQAALTGESEHVEKTNHLADDIEDPITSTNNLAFMGSDVVIGSAKGIVISVGNDTMFGSISESITEEPAPTTFEIGVAEVSKILVRFMFAMVPIVFVINGVVKGNWLEALLFSVSIAVGLTPEMLPTIVTTTLAKGANAMGKEKTIIKNLHSIQDLGAMDILCTDKTGTLTQDNVILEYHLDVMGNENLRVLRHGFLNSYFQTGLKNLMDRAIINRTKELGGESEILRDLDTKFKKVDEVPFDHSRRRMSVVVESEHGKKQMITKGAVEEMIKICKYVEYEGEVVELTDDLIKNILVTVNDLNERGMRVLAVAQKTNPRPVGQFSTNDEIDMVLLGYLAFLDPPKESAPEAINNLAEYGVETKVLTGDNDIVTKAICDMIGIPTDVIVLGSDVDAMSDAQLADAVEKVNVFAKLSPSQKSRVVQQLKDNGHTVGFLGDGINDAPAMKTADVGISVDNAVDIALESSEVILLEKDLNVLEQGIIEGRKTYANMIKYIKMTVSSNFGNVFSVLAATFFLPFLPMQPIHLILLNLIYDISCIAIPWDNVDEDLLLEPRTWDADSIKNFMIYFGPTSSIFDISTYALMFFIIAPQVVGMPYSEITDPAVMAQFIAVFQAGWFVESMWSQTLVIHLIRTEKVPFLQSRASGPLTFLTFAGIAVLTVIPFTAFGASIGLAPLPMNYFFGLAITIIAYMLLVSAVKKFFIKKYGELL